MVLTPAVPLASPPAIERFVAAIGFYIGIGAKLYQFQHNEASTATTSIRPQVPQLELWHAELIPFNILV
ncbi:hypothetical protein EVAR_74148_1 [Eumeta japonica]|uniref:Uncharacterized protein n=1 Tax=Eumeta variegata TaxID=151549 RepID=A0A4C1T028_EUMVA|nr:hypothetical protein EVAR_74148_1 [Eumeta japonica]